MAYKLPFGKKVCLVVGNLGIFSAYQQNDLVQLVERNSVGPAFSLEGNVVFVIAIEGLGLNEAYVEKEAHAQNATYRKERNDEAILSTLQFILDSRETGNPGKAAA